MKKYFFCLIASLVLSSAYAKDVPIVESLSLSVSMDKAVIEFPFAVSSISPEEFMPEKGMQNAGAPEIKKGENILEINSPTQGKIKTIIWGYDHPIFLELSFEKNGEKYYKFTSPIGKNSDIQEFESNTHEDVVADLVVAAYNEKAPKGYLSKTKRVTGESGETTWELQVEYVGNDYLVQSWKVANNGKSRVDLYEEMFVSEKNKTYGVAIEAPVLMPKEATRVFIVKKAE